MKKNNKEKKEYGALNFLALIIVTFLVLYFSLKDNFNEIVGHIANANIFWIIISILLYIGSVLVRGCTLKMMVQEFKPTYTNKEMIKLSWITQFFNGITPFSTGGQPFQVYYLKKSGVDLSDGTNIIVQNFIVYQLALIILGIIAIVTNNIFHIFKEVGLLKELVTIGFIINLAVMVGLFILTFTSKFNKIISKFIINLLHKFKIVKNKDKLHKKWDENINSFSKGAKTLVNNKNLMIKTILLNILGLAMLYAIPLTIAYSLGIYKSFDLFTAINASAYVMLIGAFVPLPGGTGGLEYSYREFFGNFIIGPQLNASMILWRFITYYLGMIIGAFALHVKDVE